MSSPTSSRCSAQSDTRSQALEDIFQDMPELSELFSQLDPFATHRRASRPDNYVPHSLAFRRASHNLVSGASSDPSDSSLRNLPSRRAHSAMSCEHDSPYLGNEERDTLSSLNAFISENRELLREDLQRAHDLSENPERAQSNPNWHHFVIRGNPPSYESLLETPPPTYKQAMKMIRKQRVRKLKSRHHSDSTRSPHPHNSDGERRNGPQYQ